jgi:hypothetical protein
LCDKLPNDAHVYFRGVDDATAISFVSVESLQGNVLNVRGQCGTTNTFNPGCTTDVGGVQSDLLSNLVSVFRRPRLFNNCKIAK